MPKCWSVNFGQFWCCPFVGGGWLAGCLQSFTVRAGHHTFPLTHPINLLRKKHWRKRQTNPNRLALRSSLGKSWIEDIWLKELKPISHASRLLGHLLYGGSSQKRKNQSLEGHLLQSFRQTMNMMTNTWWTLGKYILQFGQIHFIFWTNTFYILDKYILYFGQIHFIFLTNTFYIFDKCILYFWQTHFPKVKAEESIMQAHLLQSFCQQKCFPGQWPWWHLHRSQFNNKINWFLVLNKCILLFYHTARHKCIYFTQMECWLNSLVFPGCSRTTWFLKARLPLKYGGWIYIILAVLVVSTSVLCQRMSGPESLLTEVARDWNF